MVLRHPHVFKNKKFKNMKEFKSWWEKSKKKKQLSILDNIPFTYPAYLEANKIQKKVASVGFDYKKKLDAIDKISEELEELKIEIKAQNQRKIKEELGDLIFATLDVSRKLKLDPEIILKKANNKFSKRWRKLESLAKKENLNLNKLSLKNYDLLWNKAKK